MYAFIVPKSISQYSKYLTPAQKSLIINSMEEEKVLLAEIICADPVYIAFDLCVKSTNNISQTDINNTEIYVIKDPLSRRNNDSIKSDINNKILSFFQKIIWN